MSNIFAYVNNLLWSYLSWTVRLIMRLSPENWTALCGLAVLGVIVGWRMGQFTKPETPRISKLLRHAARLFLFWPSVLTMLAVTLVWAAYFLLCYVLSVPPRGLVVLHAYASAAGWGLTTGLVVGAVTYYWSIPGLERPASSLASPDAKLNAIGNYDPERYFRVK
jgi:hypothetical protein